MPPMLPPPHTPTIILNLINLLGVANDRGLEGQMRICVSGWKENCGQKLDKIIPLIENCVVGATCPQGPGG